LGKLFWDVLLLLHGGLRRLVRHWLECELLPLTALALLVTACGVPQVTFVGDDAAPQKDAAGDVTEAGAPDACPQNVPAGASTCCGSSPCVGRNGNVCNCNDCQLRHCASWCCVDSNGALSCVADPASCN
jgi:hypothetical protein